VTSWLAPPLTEKETIVGYKSLLVHVELGRSNKHLLEIAGELLERFDARIIGVAACAPPVMIYGDIGLAGDAWVTERSERQQQIGTAESEFRDAFRDRTVDLDWRAMKDYADLAQCIARQARTADLVVTAVAQGDMFDATRALSTGALVMQVGRPVLLVPLAHSTTRFDRVLIGWKDSRETRRAIADALPLMRRAEVTVVEVVKEGHMDAARRHLDDVVAWLMQHDVAARAFPVTSSGDDAADLRSVADSERCDVIVAGAYGHSRMREWILGGVTKDLLMSPRRCSLVSH
jgi:nucleotide-binding universal stress UspA family protein